MKHYKKNIGWPGDKWRIYENERHVSVADTDHDKVADKLIGALELPDWDFSKFAELRKLAEYPPENGNFLDVYVCISSEGPICMVRYGFWPQGDDTFKMHGEDMYSNPDEAIAAIKALYKKAGFVEENK